MGDAEKYEKQQVRKSMFHAISQNLIQQLRTDGCTRDELVGFATEILQAIIDQGFEEKGSQDGGRGGRNASGHGVSDLPRLSAAKDTEFAEGVTLGPLRQKDVPHLKEWLTDEAIAHSLAEYTLADVISRRSSRSKAADQVVFVLREQEGGVPVGLVGLIHIDATSSVGELIKMIGHPAYRGKGFAKRATQMLVDHAFEHLKLNRIYLRTLGGNMKNIRLNESLGFRFEGVLRQAACVGGTLSDIVIMGMVLNDRARAEDAGKE